MPQPIEVVLSRLDDTRQAGHGKWMARCPNHDDRRASLSVTQSGDGRVLLHCHANCATKDIVSQIGLRMRDLFPSGNGSPNQTYDYRDATGALVYQVIRKTPKGFFQRRPDGNGGWINDVRGVTRIPYRLPELVESSATVYIVEGEKDVDRLRSLGLVATTNVGGAGKWRDEYNRHFKDRNIVIVPDNDEAGLVHARSVAKAVAALAKSTKIIELPGLKEKQDISDWLDRGHTVEELATCPELQHLSQDGIGCASSRESGSSDTKKNKQRSKSQATQLVELANGVQFFHDDDEEYASIPADRHQEIWRLRSKAFRTWLSRRFYQRAKTTPNAQAIQDALSVLKGKARFEGPQRDVFRRIGGHEGRIYIDLVQDDWQVVEVNSDGWQVVDTSPVAFIRQRGMMALMVGGAPKAFRIGRRWSVLTAPELLENDKRAPILLLRRFSSDKTELDAFDPWFGVRGYPIGWRVPFEEIIAARLRGFGPVIAVARPGEEKPPLGFSRMWLANDDWKETVNRFISEARLIVVILGPVESAQEGLGWELNAVFDQVLASRVVIAIPPADSVDLEKMWLSFRDVTGGRLHGEGLFQHKSFKPCFITFLSNDGIVVGERVRNYLMYRKALTKVIRMKFTRRESMRAWRPRIVHAVLILAAVFPGAAAGILLLLLAIPVILLLEILGIPY